MHVVDVDTMRVNAWTQNILICRLILYVSRHNEVSFRFIELEFQRFVRYKYAFHRKIATLDVLEKEPCRYF